MLFQKETLPRLYKYVRKNLLYTRDITQVDVKGSSMFNGTVLDAYTRHFNSQSIVSIRSILAMYKYLRARSVWHVPPKKICIGLADFSSS